ncbi:MAG TPA: hypothetical protein VFU23_04065 [Gemmatimonadales bacterium]|nr:hypothetical protein [Gemmatimonadales bacterium]
MHRTSLFVSLALLSSTTIAQAQATKVESQLLVTGETGMEFSVSPHGGHVAVVTQKGSRWVVIYDGTVGPLFDEIPNSSYKIIWSPDGSRWAYIGRIGREYTVMVDGKEQLKVPATDETGIAGVLSKGGPTPTFTQDSKHFVYGIQVVGPGPGGARFREIRVVYDGVVGPPNGGDGPIVAYPVEGPHHAYLITARAQTALNPTGQDKQLLVVDGKVAPYVAGDLQYTADGTHLFSQRTVVIPGKGGVTELLVDGRPVMRAQAIRVFTAPAGNAFVAVVSQQPQPGVNNSFLVVGATRIPGTDCGGGYASVTFSADGKHYAAPCQVGSGMVQMVIDGKMGREYRMINEFAFSPDGTHSMYKAFAGKTFVVTGEAESDGYQAVDSLRFGGTHTGFLATKASGSSPWEVVIDGKSMPRSDATAASLFKLSPDGSHWAYITGFGNAVGLALDGVDQPMATIRGFQRDWHGARFVWSADSKHFATFGTSKSMPNYDDSGIFFDGKFLKLNVNYAFNPTFTPDGKHFLFLTQDPGNSKESVYVDGKVVVQVDVNNSLADNPAAWEVGADGVLTLVAQDAGAIKRFRITPGTDTSIETLLAMGKKP